VLFCLRRVRPRDNHNRLDIYYCWQRLARLPDRRRTPLTVCSDARVLPILLLSQVYSYFFRYPLVIIVMFLVAKACPYQCLLIKRLSDQLRADG